MSVSKAQLRNKIKRRFGWPVVKCELSIDQINDEIDYARNKFLKWAVGQATHEVFFTMLLSAGQKLYDLPMGVTEVLNFDAQGMETGINTLFTLDNFLYTHGMYASLLNPSTTFNLIGYHLVLDFMESLKKYTPDKYNWKYHRYTNQLEIQPAPPSGASLQVTLDGTIYTVDSPGFVMLRVFMVEGSTLMEDTTSWPTSGADPDFYGTDWVLDYSYARCKIPLGNIRRKFANFASIGNTGIALDGDSLISEGKEEMADLEEKLKLEETYEGLGILIG